MKTRTWQNLMALCFLMVCAPNCDAGKWKALREGFEALTKKSGKVLREGAEHGAKRSAPRRALMEGLENGTTTGGSRIGRRVAREVSEDAGTLTARFGQHVATPVISKFGDDGARALATLSPTGAKRLASMADDLAASGHGKDWMKLISERGDVVMEWLWKRKGSVAVGAIAATVVLQPEEFLRASEHVAVSTIGQIGAPFAERAAAAIPWRTIWTIALLGLIPWWIWRRGLTVGMLWKFMRTGQF